jgi:hypothetical protein
MPYIPQEDREALLTVEPVNPGELNYAITRLVLDFLGVNAAYADYNTVVGVLESCKLEFYRRAVAAYEDKKIEENGDVY